MAYRESASVQLVTGELPVAPSRVAGRVRWFSDEKGYGFIVPAEEGEDVFVRHSSIDADGFRSLRAGQQVTYELTRDGRGPRALYVRPA